MTQAGKNQCKYTEILTYCNSWNVMHAVWSSSKDDTTYYVCMETYIVHIWYIKQYSSGDIIIIL